MLMCFDESIDFGIGIDGSLQYPAGSFMDDFIEWAVIVELPPKGDHFGIERFIH